MQGCVQFALVPLLAVGVWTPELPTWARMVVATGGWLLVGAASGLEWRGMTDRRNAGDRFRDAFGRPVVLAVLLWFSVVTLGAGQGWGVAAGAVPLVAGASFALVTHDPSRVHLRDAATLERTGRLERRDPGVRAVAWSPDGVTLATGGHDGTIALWDRATHREVRRIEGHGGVVRSIAFSPDGKILATTAAYGDVRLWDPFTGNPVRELEPSSMGPLAYSPDGRLLFSGTDIRDAGSGEVLRRANFEGLVRALAVTPDGKRLAIGGVDGRLGLFAPETGQERRRLEGHSDTVSAVAFFPGGGRLASGSSDGTVRLWDVASGEEELRIEAPGPVSSLAVSPDGATVFGGCSVGLRAWDTLTGRVIRAVPRTRAERLALSPDGGILAGGG